jgi:hypothetical protein
VQSHFIQLPDTVVLLDVFSGGSEGSNILHLHGDKHVDTDFQVPEYIGSFNSHVSVYVPSVIQDNLNILPSVAGKLGVGGHFHIMPQSLQLPVI